MGTVSGTPLIVDLVGSETIKRTCERFKDPRAQLTVAVAHFLDAFDDVMVAYVRLTDLISHAHQIGLASATDPIGPVGDEFGEYRAALRALHLAQTDLRGIRDELTETPLGDDDPDGRGGSGSDDLEDEDDAPYESVDVGVTGAVTPTGALFYDLLRQVRSGIEAALAK